VDEVIRNPSCDECPLQAQKCVYGSGPMDAEVLLVAEAPGANEVEEGVPLVGWTGTFVNESIAFFGVPRSQVRVENVFQAKASYQSKLGKQAALACGPSIWDIVHAMHKLRTVIAFGEAALQELSGYRRWEQSYKRELALWKKACKAAPAWDKKHAKAEASFAKKHLKWAERRDVLWTKYKSAKTEKAAAKAMATYQRHVAKQPLWSAVEAKLGPRPEIPPEPSAKPLGAKGISKYRGSPLWLAGYEGKIRLFPTVHPAAAAPKRQPQIRPLIMADLRKAFEFHRGKLTEPTLRVHEIRTLTELRAFKSLMRPGRIGIDIENSRKYDKLVLIGLGQGEDYGVVILEQDDGWTIDGEQRHLIYEELNAWFADEAYQWGGHFACLHPNHKVLTADLRYVPAGTLKAGDKLVGINEKYRTGNHDYCESVVKRVTHAQGMLYRVKLSDGSFFDVTSRHKWLCRAKRATDGLRGTKWVETKDLIWGLHKVPHSLPRWEFDDSREAGYLAAAFDGEGCLTVNKRNSLILQFNQNEGVMLERVRKGMSDRAFTWTTNQRKKCRTDQLTGGVREVARFLGSIRPARLLAKFKPEYLGSTRNSTWLTVVDIKELGPGPFVSIETSSKTMIVEGVPHHNSGFDEHKLREYGLELTCKWDSLYSFHILHADLGSSDDEESVEGGSKAGSRVGGYDLGFVTSVLCNMPYHKGVVSATIDALDVDTPSLVRYCAKDVQASLLAQLRMDKEGAAQLPPGVFAQELAEEMALARVAREMTRYGIPIQVEEHAKRMAHWQTKAQELALQAQELLGDSGFNLGSNLQLAKELEKRGVRVKRNAETGNPMLDGNELEKLLRKYDNPLMRLVQEYRKALKEITGYGQIAPQGDGRFHPSWKPHGTVGTRCSSTPNSQNITHEQREVMG
jgi:uracil-DNA glycosylase family 4